MVAQIFSDALYHDNIKLKDINILVCDECHHATKNHPMKEIFRKYTEIKVSGSEDLPRILGLTACIVQGSPSERSVRRQMEQLECCMSSSLVTSTSQDTVKSYATQAEEKVFNYKTDESTKLKIQLSETLHLTEEHANRYVLGAPREAKEIVKKIFGNLRFILNELGLYSLLSAIKYEIDAIYQEPHSRSVSQLISFLSKELSVITKFFLENPIPDECFPSFLSNKVKCLLEILSDCKHDSAIIVFVERRNTAKLLCDLLEEVSRRSRAHAFLVPKWVVGGAHNARTDIHVKQVEAQKEALHLFRNGSINTLVSTSVLEEGIDVRACNVVIRFDPVREYRSYVQSLGRARAHPSLFAVICQQGKTAETQQTLLQYKRIKDTILSECHERSIPETDEIQRYYDDRQLPDFAPYGESGPKITSNSVLQVLNKYIGQLPGDTFTTFSINESRSELIYKKKQVGLRLPINAQTKEIFWSEIRPSYNLAKKDAALKMCQELYRLGCFTEKLLPKRKSNVLDTHRKYVKIENCNYEDFYTKCSQETNHHILRKNPFNEATPCETPTYSVDIFNFSRLEIIGDAFLKLHTSRFLFCFEKSENVVFLSENRSCIVSDFILSKLFKNMVYPNYHLRISSSASSGIRAHNEIETMLLKKKIVTAVWNSFLKVCTQITSCQ